MKICEYLKSVEKTRFLCVVLQDWLKYFSVLTDNYAPCALTLAADRQRCRSQKKCVYEN